MLFKTSLLLVVVLAATTVSAAPPDPLMWIWQNAWPRAPQQSTPTLDAPLPVARPKATRSLDHRKAHRKAPKIAKREIAPLPRMKPTPSIIAPEKRDAIKKHRKVVIARMPSCAHVKREYDRMTAAQRWAAYMAATSEQVAHGRRCLGM